MKIWIIIISVLISSLAFADEPVKVKPPANKSLTAENGRYVYGQISELRRDQYMLDTKTGRLWNLNVIVKGIGEDRKESYVLSPILYQLSDSKWSFTPD